MSEVGIRKDELDTPALWVDLDKMEENIVSLAVHFRDAGVAWRPHTKGIKVPAIAHKAIAAGAIGVTCAKLGEAEVMAAAGVSDILVANQVVGERKISRLVNLCRHINVMVAVDNPANVAQIGRLACERGVEAGVLVELNTGMERAGVAPGEAAVALSRLAAETPGVRYDGLMAWEGHTSLIEDEQEKERTIRQCVGLLIDTAAQCREAGLAVRIVSGGGSGTYKVTPFVNGMTEIQAGGAIFCDPAYQKRHVKTEPSLFVRATVTSRPVPERIIFDVGFKSLPTWYGDPVPIGLPPVASIGMSAEHGKVILAAPDTTVRVGDGFDFEVGYTDVTLFLHDTLYGVRDGVVEVEWAIEGRGKLQ
jgi:D-serine deaminase-like pyridoxal phosphate-dependent protein